MGIYLRIISLGVFCAIVLIALAAVAILNQETQTLVVAAAISAVAVVIMSTMVAAHIKGALSRLSRAVDDVKAAKDLSLRIDETQEKELVAVAASINHLLDGFGDILSRVNQSTEQLFEEVAQIASSSAEVMVSSDVQNKSVTGVVDSMVGLNSSVVQVARSADEVRLMAVTVKDLSQEGEGHVEQVASGIAHVNESFQSTQSLIQSLARRSDEIVSIIEMISDIAEQTNLLALNAAIEAARAGEQGRGFAVVADEVRNLASRTHDATVEVTRMVDGIRTETWMVVGKIEAGSKEVSACVEKTSQTSEALSVMSANAIDVTHRTDEIAAATEQQSCTVQHIEEMVRTVTEMSEKSNQSIHKSNDAIRHLLKQAMSLIVAAREYSAVERSDLSCLMQAVTEVRMNAVLATNASSAAEAMVPINEIKRLDEEVELLWLRCNTGNSDQAGQFWAAWKTFKEARAITLERSASGDFVGARENAATNAGPKFQQAKAALGLLIAQEAA